VCSDLLYFISLEVRIKLLRIDAQLCQYAFIDAASGGEHCECITTRDTHEDVRLRSGSALHLKVDGVYEVWVFC